MTFRKIEPEPDAPWVTLTECRNFDHNPPSHVVLQPGLWEWTCPGCGAKQYVGVDGPSLVTGEGVISHGKGGNFDGECG